MKKLTVTHGNQLFDANQNNEQAKKKAEWLMFTKRKEKKSVKQFLLE